MAHQTSTSSPFHAGETAVQERLGVREQIEPWARRVVRPFLPDEHQRFYAQLPFLVTAARDARGLPWVTLLAASPGFVETPDERTLRLRAAPVPGDALDGALAPGDDVGFLGIELATRRRNRVNGQVTRSDASGIDVAVGQAFGNCPQYIHEREWKLAETAPRPGRRVASGFDAELRPWIEGADTFFIATGHRGDGASEGFGMDASHRGGTPGFVQVTGERELVFPDYAGNNHYNTIGNLELDPRAGLLFVDFENGHLLQLTGRTRIDWEPNAEAVERFPGARRLVLFSLDEAVVLSDALPLRFGAPGEGLRSLRLVEKVRESDEITSFHFEARDGGSLDGFLPGQHLPIALETADGQTLERTYSLSNAPGEGHYRISVKREAQGLVSRALHDQLEVGAFVNARRPRGDFVLDDSTARPAMLISAGVGLTPMLSMAGALAAAGGERRVFFVHGARDGQQHALDGEIRELEAAHDPLRVHVSYSRPLPGDTRHDRQGRVDTDLLAELLPDLDADFYLCGPLAFLADIRDGLAARGVPDKRIHWETFGPAAG